MRWSLIPLNLSNDNNYTLSFGFENNEKEQFWIHKIQLYLPDYNLTLTNNIEKGLREPFWFNKDHIYTNFSFKLDKNIVLPHKFTVQLICRRWINQNWAPDFLMEYAPQIFQVRPQPIYRAFISRSVREEECAIPNYISPLIESWGFNAFTVGIPPLKRQYTDEELLQTIEIEIGKADIVFAIATKRDQLLRNLQWKTFEWLQSETAIAYSKNKQVLVFVEKGVELSGLAAKKVVLQFNSNNLREIDEFFDKNMYQIRENIAKRRNTESLYNFLIGVGMVGGLILIGTGGYYLGKTDSNK